jgi:hypothetical protein
MGNATCYIIMSGGLLCGEQIPNYVRERCHHVLETYDLNDYIIFSSLYTLNVPQKLTSEGYVLSEAQQTHKYFSEISNINPNKTYLEHCSYDTVGSVYFSLRMVEDLDLNVSKIMFVTSSFHLERVKILVNYIKAFFNFGHKICVEKPSNESSFLNNKRKTHEVEQMKNYFETFSKFKNRQQFVKWLYEEHGNYSTSFKSKAVRKNMAY